MNQINTAILGASGYTGAELIRLLLSHPHAHIKALSAHAHAGKKMSDVFSHLAYASLPDLVLIDDIDFTDIDVVFCCLPHATTQPIIKTLPDTIKIIDLSADFRLRDPKDYEEWYGGPHQALSLQKEAVYGLSEHYKTPIKEARLVANPGCYPTATLLPLLPLVKDDFIKKSNIIVDAKSGVSGAGRSVKQHLLFNEVSEGTAPYAVNQHRHMAELKQELKLDSITFVPHLLPQRRGMIATIYAELNDNVTYQDARQALQESYHNEPFVTMVDEGSPPPSTHDVRGSNMCRIALCRGATPSHIIIISVIDNLMKGAAGQALHNMNIMMGYEETLGLTSGVLFP